MIARVVEYHSIAEWDFSLWFALLSLREFAKNSRIFAAFAPGANRAHNFLPSQISCSDLDWHAMS